MTLDVGVFLDTSVLKAAADTRPAFLPERQTITWGDRHHVVDVHKPVLVNANTKFLRQGNHGRFADTVALRYVAAFAKEQKISLLCHDEVRIELMGLPRVAGAGPIFYGAPIRRVEDPFPYQRIAFDSSRRDHQFEFFAGVNHPRFLQLQRVSGAYQGAQRPPHRNQLIDAFHLLCAETSGAEFFLTLDDKLIRTVAHKRKHAPRVQLITPVRLLTTLLRAHPTWAWSVLKERQRIARSGRRLTEATQDAGQEFWS